MQGSGDSVLIYTLRYTRNCIVTTVLDSFVLQLEQINAFLYNNKKIKNLIW